MIIGEFYPFQNGPASSLPEIGDGGAARLLAARGRGGGRRLFTVIRILRRRVGRIDVFDDDVVELSVSTVGICIRYRIGQPDGLGCRRRAAHRT